MKCFYFCADRIDENRSPVLSKNFVFASLQLIFTKNSRPRSLRFFLHPASFLKEKQRHGRQVRYEKIYFARFDSPYSLQKPKTQKLSLLGLGFCADRIDENRSRITKSFVHPSLRCGFQKSKCSRPRLAFSLRSIWLRLSILHEKQAVAFLYPNSTK